MVKLLLVVVLVSVLAAETVGRQPHFAGEIERRTVDSHGHEVEEEDNHDDKDDSHANATCTISKSGLLEAFNEVASELNVTGEDGHVCSLPIPECGHHDNEEHQQQAGHHDNDEEDHDETNGSGKAADSMCLSVYDVCRDLILHSGLASSACLSRECLAETEDEHGSSSDRTPSAQAYGLGFLMVMLVSLASLLGVTIVPLIYAKDKSRTKALAYKYIYFFMIALGTSALLCDAILHLFPHAWDLHAHGNEEGGADDGHSHAHSEGGDGHKGVEVFIWKGMITLLAIYLFYLLEYILHGFTSHTHSNGIPTNVETEKECIQLHPTVPHGECSETTENAGIIHPATSRPQDDGGMSASSSEEALVGNSAPEEKTTSQKRRKGIVGRILAIKPLAWLIIIGDGLHNFADGLALGAAISQSLTLGVSTTIALVLHEIPHEFGDYVILLSTGLSWYSALLLNFLSALTAVLGFLVGVAAGTESEEANSWILAFAAGLFIYIALVDLLPELIHAKEKGCHRWGLFLVANFGFLLSFLALFLLAVYEEDLNNVL